MKFAAKLRLAMHIDQKNAQALSAATAYKISARRIGELADAQSKPTPSEFHILSTALDVPIEWLSESSNMLPLKIVDFCQKHNLLAASYKGELSDDMLLHLAEVLQYKENQ